MMVAIERIKVTPAEPYGPDPDGKPYAVLASQRIESSIRTFGRVMVYQDAPTPCETFGDTMRLKRAIVDAWESR